MTRRMEERDYIAPSVVKGLLPRHSKQQLEHRESSLERQMWETLEFQGADISAGDDPEALREQQRKDFEARLDQYRLWDGLEQPISNIDWVAPEHSWAADEDEDVLNDILANAGQSHIRKLVERILTLCCKWKWLIAFLTNILKMNMVTQLSGTHTLTSYISCLTRLTICLVFGSQDRL